VKAGAQAATNISQMLVGTIIAVPCLHGPSPLLSVNSVPESYMSPVFG